MNLNLYVDSKCDSMKDQRKSIQNVDNSSIEEECFSQLWLL